MMTLMLRNCCRQLVTLVMSIIQYLFRILLMSSVLIYLCVAGFGVGAASTGLLMHSTVACRGMALMGDPTLNNNER